MRATAIRVSESAAARRIARYFRCDRATTAIEFAFVSPIIVALLLATAQVAVIFIAQSYLETVGEVGMRTVLTNQANALTQAQFKTQICSNLTALFTCGSLIVDVEQAPTNAAAMAAAMPQFDSTGKLKNPTNFVIAPAPAKMLLVVMYQWPVVGGPLGLNFGSLGNGTFLLVSTQVFQIEPTS